MMNGMLASRIASHALAACSRTASAAEVTWQNWRTATTAAAASGKGETEAASLPTLTDAQRQQLPQLLAMLKRPNTAHRLGTLTALSVAYRDLSMTMSALHMRHHGIDPFWDNEEEIQRKLEAAEALSKATSGDATAREPARGTYLPVADVSLLPDSKQVDGVTEAPTEPELSNRHMDKIGCWSALQAPHIETSQALMTGINLFPPTEAAYPTFVDFDAALRKLSLHVSHKRLRLKRRLLRKQDKYQLKTWEHSPGEA